jgi:Fe-S oxidoreductase
MAAAMGGITTLRSLPRFADAREWRRQVEAVGTRAGSNQSEDDSAESVVLFVDTFTRGFRPVVAGAAARVLADAGVRAECSADACCGLTWISTGQLDTATKLLQKAAEALDDGTDRPIIVVEPSCAAALRKDLPELVHTEKARRVASRVRSFAAYINELAAGGWQPHPALALPEKVVLQTHCHEYSVFGSATQTKALKSIGVTDVVDASGCCGVAGNFGFEKQHYEISMKVAEHALAPALQETKPETTPVLTDGFSCAMQVQQLDSTRPGLHLAQLLDPASTIGASSESAPLTQQHRMTKEAHNDY